MKTKVIIENGKIQIELTPENDYEIDVLEKGEKYYKEITFHIDYGYGNPTKHKAIIYLKEKLPRP